MQFLNEFLCTFLCKEPHFNQRGSVFLYRHERRRASSPFSTCLIPTERCWADLDLTVEEGIDELAAIHMEEVRVGSTRIENIPTPNKIGRKLLKKAEVTLPSVLPSRTVNVHTKKKLPSERFF